MTIAPLLLRAVVAPILIIWGFATAYGARSGSRREIVGGVVFGLGLLLQIGPWRL